MKKASSSKTMRAAAIVAALGVVELNFHLMQDLLGDYYGLSFIALSVVMGVLRIYTSEAVSVNAK